MFWFRLLPLMGILSIPMGGEGRHPQRTRREEEVRWSSGQDPGHFSLPQGWFSSLWRRARASLTLWVLFSLSFCLIWLDLVDYRSSSDRCRCVPCVKPIYWLSALHPNSQRARPAARPAVRPGPAGLCGKWPVPPFFSFAPFASPFFPGLCPRLR